MKKKIIKKFKIPAAFSTLVIVLTLLGFYYLDYIEPASPDAGDETLLSVHFIDVGQGDAIMLQFPGGQAALIDSGEPEMSDRVLAYLRKQGVRELDFAVGTHPHSDHIGALPKVLSKVKCERLFILETPEEIKLENELAETAKNRGISTSSPEPGDVIYKDSGVEVTVLAPLGEYGSNINNASIVLLVEYGKARFLLCGDMEKEEEEDLLASGADISADVLKAGHHGSKTSSTAEFLDAVDPKCAIITCGKDNAHGYPNKKVLNRLADIGAEVFTTQNGSIVVETDGKEIRVISPKEEEDYIIPAA